MNELRARSTVNAIDNGNGDALYTVGQKSEAKNSWSSFCQIVTDLQKFFFLRLFLQCGGQAHKVHEDNHALACNFAKYSPI